MLSQAQEALTLLDDRKPYVRLHATAVFAILSSFSRREDKQARSIGTMLGTTKDGCIEISDAFGVPHLEKSDEAYVAINKDYHKTMFEFHNRINKREQIIGWYSTTFPNGNWIVDNSSLVHDFYSNECANPIHLVVDTALTDGSMCVRAFMSRPMVVGEHAFANMFDELRVEIALSEGETSCLFHMVNGQENPWQDGFTIARIPNERTAVSEAMGDLVSNLDKVIAYVDSVVAGDTAASATTGMTLADTLNALKLISPEEFQTILQGRLQDLLMTGHITTLTQTQLHLAEKLNSIL